MRIGILQTGIAPDVLLTEHGDYPQMFQKFLAGHGFSFGVWRVVEGEFPSSPQECDGWLITGSRHGVYENHAWIKPLEAFIRQIFQASIPLVGICFGHQIIAQAMGGRVEKFSGGWTVGATEYDFNDAQRLRLNAWHQDQVLSAPPGADVIARNDFCAYAALRYGDKALTFQSHPEFDPKFIKGLIETRGKGVVPQAQLEQAQSRLDYPLDSSKIAAQIIAFYKRPATDNSRATPAALNP